MRPRHILAATICAWILLTEGSACGGDRQALHDQQLPRDRGFQEGPDYARWKSLRRVSGETRKDSLETQVGLARPSRPMST